MEVDTCEQELIIGTEEIEHEEEIVETEIEPQEVEIETEDQIESSHSPETILPDVKKPVTVPPLRPLTIAPKPKQIPIAVKPMAGQQLLLLQGGTAGQTIKLVSPQGQELSLANYTISRPVTIKPTVKTLAGGNISLVQQKPVVMKKIVTAGQKTITKPVTLSKPITFGKPGQQFMVIQKPDQQPVKLVQATSPTKTITLQQAQEMGLLTNAKFLPQTQATINKQTVLINKNQQKTIKIVPQLSPAQVLTTGTTKTITLNQLKQPTKILPATNVGAGKTAQRIIFKSASGAQTILPGGHLIQMTGNQALPAGNIHQINIPGKGMQYIKFVSASSAQPGTGLVTITNAVKTASAASGGVLAEAKPSVSTTSKIAPKPITIKPAIQVNKIATSAEQMVVVPAYNLATQLQVSKVAIPQIKHAAAPHTNAPKATGTPNASEGGDSPPAPAASGGGGGGGGNDTSDPNGIRPRKPCNCTRSQCLKLYCDCFANGEFCFMCNCMNCFNNLENEEHRNRAIKACLERNPNAFRPKIGKAKDTTGDVLRKHTKGCNCKRSGCLKNYCECYEAKIACSNNCKCIGCRNIEDSMDKRSARVPNILEKSNSTALPERVYRRLLSKEDASNRSRKTSNLRKQTLSFITDDVIEATCQCLLTISEDADTIMQDEEVTKKQIIEEFGRCLTEIINCSTNRCLS